MKTSKDLDLLEVSTFLAEESRFWIRQASVLVETLRQVSNVPNLPEEAKTAIVLALRNSRVAVNIWNEKHDASTLLKK